MASAESFNAKIKAFRAQLNRIRNKTWGGNVEKK
jgi:hypothetical protein